jgi:glutathione S-transferase
MKLYGHPYSNHALRVQMLREECGIPYTYQVVDLMKGEQYTPSFLAMYPNGKVPVMDDNGFVLWESHVIMRYLADQHKAKAWYPSDLKARYQVDQWLDWNQTRLGPECLPGRDEVVWRDEEPAKFCPDRAEIIDCCVARNSC